MPTSAQNSDSRPETLVWEGRPALRYFGWQFVVCGLLGALIVPALYAVWLFVQLRYVNYRVTNERIRQTTGVFNRKWQDLELHRVKDCTMVQSFWRERVWGIARLEIESGDKSSPTLLIVGLPLDEAMALWESIRNDVERLRASRRTLTVEEI